MAGVWSAYLGTGPNYRGTSPSFSPAEGSSRRDSFSSTQDAHSNTSAQHMLLDNKETDYTAPLNPQTLPFSTYGEDASNVSLTVNYLPSKFSAPGPRQRRIGKSQDIAIPKLGGGVEAFKTGEHRIAGQGDSYDGVQNAWVGRKAKAQSGKKMRWNKFKWVLFASNLVLTIYSFVALIYCLLVWFDVWDRADVIRVANRPELIISTFAACLGIFTCNIGWAGILMNNRCFLAWYTFLTWVVFIFVVAPGYITYRRRVFNLEGKLNAQWSQDLGVLERGRVQNQLNCCGYFSPFVEAAVTQTCYARSIIPGCKRHFLDFERIVLKKWYTVSFALVPVQLVIMISGLLCSNHVTYRFGKGMMPKAYRLSLSSMALIMDNYATQLAEQYGADVASEIVARSKSNVHLDVMPTMPYGATRAHSYNTKYETIGATAPEGS